MTDGLNGLSNVTSQPVSGLETGNMSDSSSGSSSSSGSDFSSDSDTDQSDSEVEPNKSKQIFFFKKMLSGEYNFLHYNLVCHVKQCMTCIANFIN